jgi:hypothetical protein
MKTIKIEKLPKYIHLSKNLINCLYKKNEINHIKPQGFYFAYKTEWLEHDINEDSIKFNGDIINIVKDIYLYRVKFKKSTKLIKINSINKLIKFTEKYSFLDNEKFWTVNWLKLRNKYDGLIVSNFKDIDFIEFKEKISKQLDVDYNKYYWFFMLDCNGVCIWNVDKIKIKLII